MPVAGGANYPMVRRLRGALDTRAMQAFGYGNQHCLAKRNAQIKFPIRVALFEATARQTARAPSRETTGARNVAEIVPIQGAYGIPLALDKYEARGAAGIVKRIEAEITARWPNDPTPRDTRMLTEDAADFAREGATVDVFDAVMVRGWPRMTRPPARLSSYRSDMIAMVRRWITYKRWIEADRKGSDPWRPSWDAPPDAKALARFVIPAAYRKPDEAAAITRIRPSQQEG